METSKLTSWIAADFGIRVTSLTEVRHGADTLAQVWQGVSDSGASFAIKLTAGGSAAGLVVPSLLHHLRVPGMPAPIPSTDRRLWSEREGHRLSMVPWISGRQAFREGLHRPQWIGFGEMLAQVHSADVDVDLPVEEHKHDRHWQTASLVSEALKHPADSLMEKLQPLWAASRVKEVLDLADDLAARLEPAANVLCHGDPHLGNVLVDAHDQIWLIDWDDAIFAPRERDLLFFLGGGVLAFAPVTPQQQEWFFQGYGPASVDPQRLSYHRCVRALEDLTNPAAQIISPGRWSEAERAFALSIVEAILSLPA